MREAQFKGLTGDQITHTEPRSGASVEIGNDEYTLSLKELLQMVRRRALTIVLVATLLVAAAVGLSLMQPPVYQASTTILVGQERDNSSSDLANNVAGLQQVSQTVVEAVDSRVVAEAVIEETNLNKTPETLLENTTVQQVAETQFIQIDYAATDPEQAQEVANALAGVTTEQIERVSPSAAAITATVWEPAITPTIPVSPEPFRNGLLALMLGLVLGLGLAFLLESLDDSWHSAEEVEQFSGIPTFGVVPQFKAPRNVKKPRKKKDRAPHGSGAVELTAQDEPSQNGSKEKGHRELRSFDNLVAAADPSGVAAEAYRSLRTNLFYALVDNPPKVIALTSSNPKEGKSTTCANLSVMLAQAGKSILLLDCDLRRPQAHEIFGIRNLQGMSDVLTNNRSLEEAWQEPLPNLKVLTAGMMPPNPAELLGSHRFADLLRQAREKFDYVIVDAPPVELVSDPLIIANHSDGVLFVLDAQNTRKVSLRHSMRSLAGVEANVFGTVMNNVDTSKKEYRPYQSYTYQ